MQAQFVLYPHSTANIPLSEAVFELRHYPNITEDPAGFTVVSNQLNYAGVNDAEAAPFRFALANQLSSGDTATTADPGVLGVNLKVLAQSEKRHLTRWSGALEYAAGIFQNQNTYFQIRTVICLRNAQHNK